jgi:hypothetical protein
VALGVVDAWVWACKPKDQPDVKESLRWVEGYAIVTDLAETVPDSRLVYVADREGDLRALIDAAARRGAPADWLVRAKHNRKTTTGEKLWERLARSDLLGEIEFTLPVASDRPARLVRQTLYGQAVWPAAWIVAHRAPPPETPPPLGQMVRLIVGFGGFLGHKHDGYPGPGPSGKACGRSTRLPSRWRPARAVYAGDG